MGSEFALALGIATLVGGAAYGGYAASQASQKGSGGGSAPSAAAVPASGTMSDEESTALGAKRMFRIGAFYTSPTGVLNSAPRRGAKLVGE
jgi:hypothetical protein